jgi:hypothetical protein
MHSIKDNTKMDLREIGRGGVGWIDLTQNREQWRALMNMAMKLQVPNNAGKFLSSCPIGSFSGRAQLHKVSYTVSFVWQLQSHISFIRTFQGNRLHPLVTCN